MPLGGKDFYVAAEDDWAFVGLHDDDLMSGRVSRRRQEPDALDYVIGVDPHRDTHALAIVDVRTGTIVVEASVAASSSGYANALELAELHAPARRAFAIEGTGSFGAGLTRFLARHDERVLEVGRLRRERRSGGKTDALDAVRAARSVLAQTRPAEPRA